MVSAKDWEGLESSLQDLTNQVSALRAASETGAGGKPSAAAASASSSAAAPPLPAPATGPPAVLAAQGEQRRRMPSVFAATNDGDMAMLNRCYKPNIFAWDKCEVGVHDDVDDLQLRIGYRLRAREEALKKQDLDALKSLQADEMRDADEFMQSFDVQHHMRLAPPPSLQGPMLPRTARSALIRSASAAAAPCKTANAGPLPSRKVAFDDGPAFSQWPPLRPPPLAGRVGWELSDELLRARPESRLPPACWSPALADILAAAPGGFLPLPGAWPRF